MFLVYQALTVAKRNVVEEEEEEEEGGSWEELLFPDLGQFIFCVFIIEFFRRAVVVASVPLQMEEEEVNLFGYLNKVVFTLESL